MPTSTRADATPEISMAAAPAPAISHFFILHLPAADAAKLSIDGRIFAVFTPADRKRPGPNGDNPQPSPE